MEAAVCAIGRLGAATDPIQEELGALADHPDEAVREAVAWALARFDPAVVRPSVVDGALRMLRDNALRVRRHVVEFLKTAAEHFPEISDALQAQTAEVAHILIGSPEAGHARSACIPPSTSAAVAEIRQAARCCSAGTAQ